MRKIIKSKFIGKGTKGLKEKFLIFLGTENEGEPDTKFYIRDSGKYALNTKLPKLGRLWRKPYQNYEN